MSHFYALRSIVHDVVLSNTPHRGREESFIFSLVNTRFHKLLVQFSELCEPARYSPTVPVDVHSHGVHLTRKRVSRTVCLFQQPRAYGPSSQRTVLERNNQCSYNSIDATNTDVASPVCSAESSITECTTRRGVPINNWHCLTCSTYKTMAQCNSLSTG